MFKFKQLGAVLIAAVASILILTACTPDPVLPDRDYTLTGIWLGSGSYYELSMKLDSDGTALIGSGVSGTWETKAGLLLAKFSYKDSSDTVSIEVSGSYTLSSDRNTLTISPYNYKVYVNGTVDGSTSRTVNQVVFTRSVE